LRRNKVEDHVTRTLAYLPLVLLLLAPNLLAEVNGSNDLGFTSQHTLVIAAPRARVFTALTSEIDRWWDAAHSYSGSAANFSLDARPGGCFCEAMPHGGVEHMRVVFVAQDSELRMQGGLGPLQTMAVSGSMQFLLDDVAGGTRLRYSYSVGGYHGDGLAAVAPAVDSVQLGQLERLKRYIETGNPAVIEST